MSHGFLTGPQFGFNSLLHDVLLEWVFSSFLRGEKYYILYILFICKFIYHFIILIHALMHSAPTEAKTQSELNHSASDTSLNSGLLGLSPNPKRLSLKKNVLVRGREKKSIK